MSRDFILFLEDILDRVSRTEALIAGRTFEEFASDDALHEATLRHLTIIGEAVKNLPVEMLESEPDVAWRKIARLRDLLVHVYFGVKDEIIWGILSNDLRPLAEAVRRLSLKNDPQPE